MAPLPIKPTVTRLLGGSALSAPSARPGMMSGIPRNAAAAAVRPRKLRRVMEELREDWERGFFMKYSFLPKAYTPEVDQGSGNFLALGLQQRATPLFGERRALQPSLGRSPVALQPIARDGFNHIESVLLIGERLNPGGRHFGKGAERAVHKRGDGGFTRLTGRQDTQVLRRTGGVLRRPYANHRAQGLPTQFALGKSGGPCGGGRGVALRPCIDHRKRGAVLRVAGGET